MASCAPACSLGQTCIVIIVFTDLGEIRLDMAAQTQILIPYDQHLVINGAVHFVAGGASVTQGLMFPGERTAHVFMALEAGLVNVFHTGRCPWSCINTVKIVTISATHFPLENRVMIRKIKFRFFVHMTNKAGRWIFARIDDIVFSAGGFRVNTARPVTHFTTLGNAFHVFAADPRMSRELELPAFFFMASDAGLRSHIGRLL